MVCGIRQATSVKEFFGTVANRLDIVSRFIFLILHVFYFVALRNLCRYSYYTAGSGGAGPTILATSFLLLGEEAIVYVDGKVTLTVSKGF